jgi:hypothetical protein
MSIIYIKSPSLWPRIAFAIAVVAMLWMIGSVALAGVHGP